MHCRKKKGKTCESTATLDAVPRYFRGWVVTTGVTWGWEGDKMWGFRRFDWVHRLSAAAKHRQCQAGPTATAHWLPGAPWLDSRGVSLGRLLRRAMAKIIKRQASLQPACFEILARKLRPTALRSYTHSRSAFLIFLLHPHSNHPKLKNSTNSHRTRSWIVVIVITASSHVHHRHQRRRRRSTQTHRHHHLDPQRGWSLYSLYLTTKHSKTNDGAVNVSQGPGGIALLAESVPAYPTLYERKKRSGIRSFRGIPSLRYSRDPFRRQPGRERVAAPCRHNPCASHRRRIETQVLWTVTRYPETSSWLVVSGSFATNPKRRLRNQRPSRRPTSTLRSHIAPFAQPPSRREKRYLPTYLSVLSRRCRGDIHLFFSHFWYGVPSPSVVVFPIAPACTTAFL